MQPPTKRGTYEASFRLKVIEVAKTSNNCTVARTFDVTEKLVRDWSLLVWNMFQSHITESCKARLSRTNTDIAVVHSGLTSLLQPLHRPFKDSMREEWINRMLHGENIVINRWSYVCCFTGCFV